MKTLTLVLVLALAGCVTDLAPEAVPSGDNADIVRLTVIVIGGDAGHVPAPTPNIVEDDVVETPNLGDM